MKTYKFIKEGLAWYIDLPEYLVVVRRHGICLRRLARDDIHQAGDACING